MFVHWLANRGEVDLSLLRLAQLFQKRICLRVRYTCTQHSQLQIADKADKLLTEMIIALLACLYKFN